MPRPRTRSSASSPRSERTARDNARARALGYASYYDWRAHGSGRVPPDQPRLSGAALARARGHDSRADLQDAVRADSLVAVSGFSRGADGRFTSINLTHVKPDGSERQYTIRGAALQRDRLIELLAELDDLDVTVDPYLVALSGGASSASAVG